jgi:hypothetical protein
MEEEDDDLYDPAETLPAAQLQGDITKSIPLNTKPPQVEEIEEVVEEIDEDEVRLAGVFTCFFFFEI